MHWPESAHASTEQVVLVIGDEVEAGTGDGGRTGGHAADLGGVDVSDHTGHSTRFTVPLPVSNDAERILAPGAPTVGFVLLDNAVGQAIAVLSGCYCGQRCRCLLNLLAFWLSRPATKF